MNKSQLIEIILLFAIYCVVIPGQVNAAVQCDSDNLKAVETSLSNKSIPNEQLIKNLVATIETCKKDETIYFNLNRSADLANTRKVLTTANTLVDAIQSRLQVNLNTDRHIQRIKNEILNDISNLPTNEQRIMNQSQSFKKMISGQDNDGVTAALDDYKANNKVSWLQEELEKAKTNTQPNTLQAEDPVIPNWREEAFTFEFYTGFEYNDVDTIFSETNIRFGLLTYFRPGNGINKLGRDVSTRQANVLAHDVNVDHWFSEFPHFYTSIAITGAGEEVGADAAIQVSSDQNDTDGQVPQDNNDEPPVDEPPADDSLTASDTRLRDSDFQSIDIEIGAFWPFYIGYTGDPLKQSTNSSSSYQSFAIGPVVNYGLRKTDELDSFEDRYYMGIRTAFNEETYFEATWGRTEPLEGDRVQLRFQIPVAKAVSGRILLGGSANFEVSRGATDSQGNLVSEPDSLRAYVLWQTDFESIF